MSVISEQIQKPIMKKLGLLSSFLLLSVSLVFIILGYTLLGIRLEALLCITAIFISFIALWLGHTFQEIIDEIVKKFAQALPSLMIVMCVGGVIGVWMSSGTIPYLITIGLEIINPQYIVFIAFIVTSIVATCTGTSWGSAGTIGVALMGVAHGLDANLAAVAGAIVGGAYFGDKISPLSGSSNFAAIVNNLDLYVHIKHLCKTTIPAYLISAVVYFVIGLNTDATTGSIDSTRQTVDQIQNLYHTHWILSVPIFIVLVGALMKKPVIPVLLFATAISIAISYFTQGIGIIENLNIWVSGFSVSTLTSQSQDVPETIRNLLERGGVTSMMPLILVILCAFSFAGPLSLTQALDTIINYFTLIVKSAAGLIFSTIAACIALIAATGNNNIACLLPSELFRKAFENNGLHRKNISRTVEDAATVIEPLIPWTAAGVFMAATLGVPTLDYALWAIQCYAGLIIAGFYAVTGLCIAKTDDNQNNEELVDEK
ncbi:Na+/H+ antiporter NhaC [Morganella morganii]|uniref:Na+/H+ antiporter NhaC n=1 Tax=Morganella morganii TaxID=582 RepID=UPI001D1477AE|nr:Na+/H+ antiporter NhaC [Morganella morganii]